MEYGARQKSRCHFHRHNVLRAAVAQVFVQIRPKTLLPHDGDTAAAIDSLMPVMEQVFKMSPEPDASSSDGMIKELITSGDYTYEDCCEFPAVMKHHIKKMIDEGREDGFPIRKPDEVVPDDANHYQATATAKYQRSSTQAHKHLPFVRMASVSAAIKDMKNAGVYFVSIKAKDMSTSVNWNNFAIAGNTFVVYYCAREGIMRTQALARQVLLFVFYGFMTWVTRQAKTRKVVTRKKPVIFYLAKTLINGRSRLANGVQKNFSVLLSLLKKDPSLKDFLEDNGDGHPPMEFLIAVEKGLRAYAADIHTMGTKPLRSAYYWGNHVPLWRKREAYIALCRYVAGKRSSYPQWDCFLFSDYAQRQRAGKTFLKRH